MHLGSDVQWYEVNDREDDIWGLGITYIETSSLLFDAYKENETAIEVLFHYQLNQHFAITPDLQFMANLAADISAQGAFVLAIPIALSV